MVSFGEATQGKAGDRGDNCRVDADWDVCADGDLGGDDSAGRDVCADWGSGDCVATRDAGDRGWGTDCGCDCCNEDEVGGGSDSSSPSGTGLGASNERSACLDMIWLVIVDTVGRSRSVNVN